MPKTISQLLPNLPDRNMEVLLFHDCECIEHFPYGNCSAMIGRLFCDVCDLLEVTLPFDCPYAYYRFKTHKCTVKEFGDYNLIINTKIILPQNV